MSWSDNIERLTLKNKWWRKVIHTSPSLQVVVMSVPVGESLGWEKHDESDQFFRVESGQAVLETRSTPKAKTKTEKLTNGYAAVVPVGLWHNVTNTSKTEPLQLYTIYSPPHHPPNRLDRHKPQQD